MGILSLDAAAAPAALASQPFGAATPSGLGQILEILKIVRDIANSPLAMNLGARFTQGGTSQVQQAPPVQGKPAPGPGTTPPALLNAHQFDEETLLAILSTPDGRERFAKGIEAVIDALGDVHLSECVRLLRSADLNALAEQHKVKQKQEASSHAAPG